nr:TPA_asm: hypothetical protein HUJ06_012326 [Nelumbo nucifera]
MELFRPAPEIQSNAQSFLSSQSATLPWVPPMATVHAEDFQGRRELPSDHEEGRREPPSDPLFLSEKEYRLYGLVRRPSNPPDISYPTAPAHYGRGQRMGQPAPLDGETGRDALFLSEREYRTYGLAREPPTSTLPATGTSVPHTKESCYPVGYGPYGAVYSGVYPPLPRRETASSEHYPLVPRRESYRTDSDYQERGTADYLGRRRPDEVEGSYSTYASNVLSDYNQRHHLGGRGDLTSQSVSSRYSFAGPPSYR